jgi:uncharacterized membrane protein
MFAFAFEGFFMHALTSICFLMTPYREKTDHLRSKEKIKSKADKNNSSKKKEIKYRRRNFEA